MSYMAFEKSPYDDDSDEDEDDNRRYRKKRVQIFRDESMDSNSILSSIVTKIKKYNAEKKNEFRMLKPSNIVDIYNQFIETVKK